MSDAESDAPEVPDADAWAAACEEDLAAERSRRRAEQGQQHGSAAEELRRLADAVSEKVADLGGPFGGSVAGAAAQGLAQQLISQARAAVEPVVERNPEVFDHLAAAGGELLAAYRAAVQEAEGRWTAGAGSASGTSPAGAAPGPDKPGEHRGAGSRPSAAVERVDLDENPAQSAEGAGESRPEQESGEERADGHGASADAAEDARPGETGQAGEGESEGPEGSGPESGSSGR